MHTSLVFTMARKQHAQGALSWCLITGEPVQTRTLEALQRDRKRIAKLIEEDGKP